MNQKPTDNLTFDEEALKQLSLQYVDTTLSLAKGLKLPLEEVEISEKSLALALGEAKTDLDVMSMRRKPQKGISKAKIAGILTFRLSRFAPINLRGSALENDDAVKINDLAALALALKAVLHLDIGSVSSTNATKELQYTLARRHMNQETLGLAFELLAGQPQQREKAN